MARNIYLSNKRMLEEIHLSKITYCSFKDIEKHNQFDLILEYASDIFETMDVEVKTKNENDEIEVEIIKVPAINLAKENRAARLSEKTGTEINPEDIPIEDLVFRVMTEEHIPMIPKKKPKAELVRDAKRAKSEALFDDLLDNDWDDEEAGRDPNAILVPVRVNFPPFYHYVISDLEKKELELVGKSHWKGDLITGEFSQTHGNMTNNLAEMHMKLCERYGKKGRWRGYSYVDEMKNHSLMHLCNVGLKFNEFKSQNPFSYTTQIIAWCFVRVLNIERKMQNIRDDILETNGLEPSWTRQYENQMKITEKHDAILKKIEDAQIDLDNHREISDYNEKDFLDDDE